MVQTNSSFDVVSPFQGDPFVGHLATPITNSNLTKTYLSLLPAYKSGLSPILRGLSIGFVHGYFLVGPFTTLGPLRDSQMANFIGYLSTLGLLLILTTCLFIYGYVTFPEKGVTRISSVDFLNQKGWSQFTSGFITAGFIGTTFAYAVLRFGNFDFTSL